MKHFCPGSTTFSTELYRGATEPSQVQTDRRSIMKTAAIWSWWTRKKPAIAGLFRVLGTAYFFAPALRAAGLEAEAFFAAFGAAFLAAFFAGAFLAAGFEAAAFFALGAAFFEAAFLAGLAAFFAVFLTAIGKRFAPNVLWPITRWNGSQRKWINGPMLIAKKADPIRTGYDPGSSAIICSSTCRSIGFTICASKPASMDRRRS